MQIFGLQFVANEDQLQLLCENFKILTIKTCMYLKICTDNAKAETEEKNTFSLEFLQKLADSCHRMAFRWNVCKNFNFLSLLYIFFLLK